MIGKLLLNIGKNLSKAGSSATPGKLCNFYPHLRSQTVFPALNLPKNCYITTIVSPTQHIYPAWKTNLTIWQNVKAKEEILISQLFSELGKIWKFFQELWKINNSSWSSIQKSQFSFSLWVGKKLESPNFEYIDDLRNVMS